MPNDYQNLDIRYLKGVGEVRAKQFEKLGITTVGALLRLYPRRYIDLSQVSEVATAPLDTPVALLVTLERKQAPRRLSGGRTLFKSSAYDDSGSLEITIFNNRFAAGALKEGSRYLLYGKLTGTFLKREITNPLILDPAANTGMIAQYPATEGLSSKIISNAVKNALLLYGDKITETLPVDLLSQYSLPPLGQAIHDVHLPANSAAANAARRRLIFDELLTLQLGMLRLKERNRKRTSSVITKNDASGFLRSLPFEPTGAQLRCVGEICADLAGETPMNRLLQGDVGSGKTAVAAAAAYCSYHSGFQTAVMAPTELLARQHAETFERLLAPFGVNIGLLTGSVKGAARKLFYQKLANGEIDLAVGTHAMITENVSFCNLGLVVADEQHRFGVEQRALLSAKGANPHTLVMSATPIPRTLALIIYGDLDISVIDEMPKGRKPVKTYLVDDSYRERYLSFVRKAAAAGKQAYIVCPLVEHSDALEDTLAATEYKQTLEQNYLKGTAIGLVHGRMKADEKNAAMAAFANGEISVLVSTTVIEVGLDVQNATVMLIENAERFGLSALHQLRGRVGRGKDESYCVLVSPVKDGPSHDRLTVLTTTNNGFEIAKADLAARGPGDFFGKRQHGLPALAIADLATDERELYDSQALAKQILAEDPALASERYRALASAVDAMFSGTRKGMFN